MISKSQQKSYDVQVTCVLNTVHVASLFYYYYIINEKKTDRMQTE